MCLSLSEFDRSPHLSKLSFLICEGKKELIVPESLSLGMTTSPNGTRAIYDLERYVLPVPTVCAQVSSDAKRMFQVLSLKEVLADQHENKKDEASWLQCL